MIDLEETLLDYIDDHEDFKKIFAITGTFRLMHLQRIWNHQREKITYLQKKSSEKPFTKLDHENHELGT